MSDYTLPVQKDNKTDELFLEFPDDLMEKLGWAEGDTLTCLIEDDRVMLSKK